jgi:hypothetical protein
MQIYHDLIDASGLQPPQMPVNEPLSANRQEWLRAMMGQRTHPLTPARRQQ